MPTKKKSSYKKLVSNTLIFALGSFSSKILILLLVNVYTTYLTPKELGINDVIQQIANWLLPVVTLTVSESVIRFGLDKAYDKKQVFTIGNIACLMGFAGLGIILPIVTVSGVADRYLQGYSALLYVYIVTASLKQVYSYFLRALEMVKLYAVTSILATLLTLIGTVLFICAFKMGNTGYLISIIISDLICTAFMLFAAKMWKYFSLRSVRRSMLKTMFSYCLPLIPAQIMWLVTNSSDSFMTTYYLGSDRNGILSASYKIANLVSTVYLMFGQAWNMSAILEDDSDDRNEFYENVFHLNQCLLYILAAGCLMLCRPITSVWMGESFQESVRYAPILIYSTVFSCFTTFMGSIYLASNKTKRSLFTSVVSGVINVSVNLMLIPKIGLYAPPISTVVSYLTVFIVRACDSRKIVPFDLKVGKLIKNNALLVAMTLISVIDTARGGYKLSLLTLPVLFLIILSMNVKPVWNALVSFLPTKISEILRRIGMYRFIAAAAAALIYLAFCYLYRPALYISLTVICSAAAAYGIVRKKEPVRLAGFAGIFLSVWFAAEVISALITLLVLCAFDYLRSPKGVTSFAGSVCLVSLMGLLCHTVFAVLAALIIIVTAAISHFNEINVFLQRILNHKSYEKSSKEK